MRLEDRDHARAASSVRAASIVARDLGRVVGVVVDEAAPAGVVPEPLEAPAGAREGRQRARRRGGVGAGEPAAVERRGGVAGVVGPGTGARPWRPSTVKRDADRRSSSGVGVERRRPRPPARAPRSSGRSHDDPRGRPRQERAERLVEVACEP